MKKRWLAACFLLSPVLWAAVATPPPGRILSVEVTKRDGRVRYWQNNTPVFMDDEFVVHVSVQVKDKIYMGEYVSDRESLAPPIGIEEKAIVKVRFDKKRMFLTRPNGEELATRIISEKPGDPSKAPVADPSAKPLAIRQPTGPTGVVRITTTPAPAEIYVDGAFVGNSPAKLTLPAGVHTLRLFNKDYHPYNKEVKILPDSESALTVQLE